MTQPTINSQTQIYGVWGDPIMHSLSPNIHNAAFAHAKINAAYLAFHVRQGQLAIAVSGAKALGLRGWNLTIPHKEAILPLLDDIDPIAKQIGAVNTVHNHHGRLIGYNTDGVGFLHTLVSQTGFNPTAPDQHVVVIGAGGAARAVLFSLAQAGIKQFTLLNRTLARAKTLCQTLTEQFPHADFRALPLVEPIATDVTALATLLVQTSSRGLHDSKPITLDWASLKQHCIVADLVYGQTETAFLAQARSRKLTLYHGVSMLLGQASEAFKIWTGHGFDLKLAQQWLNKNDHR